MRFKTVSISLITAALVGTSMVGAHAAVDSKAVSFLPASIKKSGQIVVGVDATYAPNEFKDANGNPIGWEIDLFNAIAAKLGVKAKYVVATFDNIIPAIKGGKYDVGVSSFTDDKARESSVDFADYYNAGIQWAAPKGTKVNPDNACGLIVSAQTGSTEISDITDPKVGKNVACAKAKKKPIRVLNYDDQGAATAAVVLGHANAMSADSPVTEYAVAQSKGKLVLVGGIYATALYGYPVAKGSKLADALATAVGDLAKDGTYKAILKKWGVSAGAISTFGVNGATN
jgi:polar amino acid transport system substrate-binding protein